MINLEMSYIPTDISKVLFVTLIFSFIGHVLCSKIVLLTYELTIFYLKAFCGTKMEPKNRVILEYELYHRANKVERVRGIREGMLPNICRIYEPKIFLKTKKCDVKHHILCTLQLTSDFF